ncbi:MAG: signal peptide peptidase SppA [Planctomycetales bacterium]|nr:signal peptide peptidase SppA [Planctomycetales bacterium]
MSSPIPPADNPAGAVRQPVSSMTPPPQVIVQQQVSALGRYGKLLLILLVFAVMALVGLTSSYQSYFSPPGGPQERYHSLSKEANEKIAIVSVVGTIIESNDFVKKQLDRVREDEEVVALVLRIDSPGGTVTASDYLLHHVRKLCKERELPLVVSMGSICASGGYYVAMAVGDAEEVIFAEPSTWTGSIGVVIPHYDLSGLLASHEIKDDSIASHKYKLMGSPTRALSDEERAEERRLFQELVDESFKRFKDIVRSGRPEFQNDDAALEAIATGQIFTAGQAVEKGLVDKIGFIEDAVERAAELANRDLEEVRCIKYEEPPVSLSTLLSSQANQPPLLGADLQGLLDLTAPRAYYLCTWLPSILSNSKP